MILDRRMKEIVAELKQAVLEKKISNFRSSAVNASGKLYDSIKGETYQKGFVIHANDYIYYLEFGRGPSQTGGGKSVGRKPGSSLFDRILQWIRDKGITPDDPKTTEKQLAFLITRKIHQEGTTIFRQFRGQPSGLVSDIVNNDMINSLAGEIGDEFVRYVASDILKDLNFAA